jgi:glyoxylase I family protein
MNAIAPIKSTLHHNAYVCKDLEAVRQFYEEVIGFKLVATWAERTDLFGKVRTYAHCFFDIGDGSCLAFFQFADEDDAQEFGPELPRSGFRHLAMKVDQETQDALKDRLEAAGYFDSGEAYPLNHGYCWSLYVFDPSGLLVEFTVDHEDVEQINKDKAANAHSDLKQWLSGDHTPNNEQFHR